MDKRESIPCDKLIRDADSDRGRYNARSLLTIRVPLTATIYASFGVGGAKTNRVLVNRVHRDQRKIRVFMAPGEMILITHEEGSVMRSEYLRATDVNGNLRLLSAAGPAQDERFEISDFVKLNDGRDSILNQTLERAFNALVGPWPVPGSNGNYNTLSRVVLTSIPHGNVAHILERTHWYAPTHLVYPTVLDAKSFVPVAGYQVTDLIEQLSPEQYLVGIDIYNQAIRILSKDPAAATTAALVVLSGCDILHYRNRDYHLLNNFENDLVKLTELDNLNQ